MSRAPGDRSPGSDADLMRAWREASHDEPPAALDDAIRAAARQAVHARPRPIAGSPFGSRWRVPLSVAAVLVVSATVTLLVAERERHSSRSLHDQAAPPVAPGSQVHGESAAERSKTPVRQFAEPGAPAPVTSAAPRERESSRTAPSALEESKAVSSAAPVPSSSAEKSLGRSQPAQESAAQMPAREAAPVEADRSEGQRAETQQPGAVSVAPAPAAAPPAQRADDALRDAARPAIDESAADLAKRENRAAAKAEQAAGGAPVAPTAMQPSRQQAAAPKPKPQAFPAAPPTQASPEGAAAEAAQDTEPKVWLDRILELRRQGKLEEADKSLKAFRERYPAYPLPPELKSLP